MSIEIAVYLVGVGAALSYLLLRRQFPKWFEEKLGLLFEVLDQDDRRGSFKFHGRKYSQSPWDFAVIRFLSDLGKKQRAARRETDPRRPRLMSLRPEFAKIIADRPVSGLAWCLANETGEARRIAIWLLGRCGRATVDTTDPIAIYKHESQQKIILELLRQVGAWKELRRITQKSPDPNVQRLAEPVPFAERLHQFVGRDVEPCAPLPLELPPRPLFTRLPLGPGRPPKNAALIRRLLEHIRWLVRGGVGTGRSK